MKLKCDIMRELVSLCKIRVKHEFIVHDNTADYLFFSLSPESKIALMRKKVLLKLIGLNEWGLIALDGLDTLDDKMEITLDLTVKDNKFYHVTDWNLNQKLDCIYDLRQSDFNRLFDTKELSSSPGRLPSKVAVRFIFQLKDIHSKDEKPCMEIYFHAHRVYWEYLFIPRDGNLDRKLFLEDKSGQIAFEELYLTDLMNMQVLCCRSKDKILMKEYFPYIMELSEQSSLGKKILMRNIPVPESGKYVSSSPDTIRQILYI